MSARATGTAAAYSRIVNAASATPSDAPHQAQAIRGRSMARPASHRASAMSAAVGTSVMKDTASDPYIGPSRTVATASAAGVAARKRRRKR